MSRNVLIFLILATICFGQAPRMLNYQGKLTTIAGDPISGVRDFEFSIYTTATGGSYLWKEEQYNIAVSKGNYGVQLGSLVPFPTSLDFLGSYYYLGIRIRDNSVSPWGNELLPRVRLLPVPTALSSEALNAQVNQKIAQVTNDFNRDISNVSAGLYREMTNVLNSMWAALLLTKKWATDTWTSYGVTRFVYVPYTVESAKHSVSVDNTGVLYHVHQYYPYANPIEKAVKKWEGGAWQDVGNYTGLAWSGCLAFNSDNVPHIAAGANVQYYNNTAWVNLGGTLPDGGGYYSMLAIDKNNIIYVFYNVGGKAVIAKYSGGTWVKIGFTDKYTTEYTKRAIALDQNNNLYFVGTQDTVNGKLGVVMKYNGSSWQQVGPDGFANMKEYSIAIDKNSVPYVGYVDNTTLYPHVVKFNGSSWEELGTMPLTPVCRLSFEIDKNNFPYMAYEATTGDKLMRVMAYDGLSWQTVGSLFYSTGLYIFSYLYADQNGSLYNSVLQDQAPGQGNYKGSVLKW